MANNNKRRYNQKGKRNSNPKNAETGKTKNLKALYEKLDSMSEAEIQARIEEIEKELEQISVDIARKQINGMTDLEEDEEVEDVVDVQDLLSKARKLQDEKTKLKYFPQVKGKLKKIADLQEETIDKKAKAQEEARLKFEKANQKLEEAKEKQSEAKKKMIELDEEIEEIKQEMEDMKEKLAKRPKMKAGMEEEIKELEEQKASLGTKEDFEKMVAEAESEVKKAQEGLGVYISRKKRRR